MNEMGAKKRYTLGEEIFSSVSHGIGAGLSVFALVAMILRTVGSGDVYAIVSSVVFGASLIILYTMSTLYHALTNATAKKVFRIFDHVTIFLLIAGTYTPYLLVSLRGSVGWTIFFIMWALCAFGILLDTLALDRFKKLEMLLYVGMGWCIVFASGTLTQNLEKGGLAFLLTGGILYTVGIVFYAMKKVRYMHSVWHLFVLAGSVLHFFSVYFYVL